MWASFEHHSSTAPLSLHLSSPRAERCFVAVQSCMSTVHVWSVHRQSGSSRGLISAHCQTHCQRYLRLCFKLFFVIIVIVVLSLASFISMSHLSWHTVDTLLASVKHLPAVTLSLRPFSGLGGHAENCAFPFLSILPPLSAFSCRLVTIPPSFC